MNISKGNMKNEHINSPTPSKNVDEMVRDVASIVFEHFFTQRFLTVKLTGARRAIAMAFPEFIHSIHSPLTIISSFVSV